MSEHITPEEVERADFTSQHDIVLALDRAAAHIRHLQKELEESNKFNKFLTKYVCGKHGRVDSVICLECFNSLQSKYDRLRSAIIKYKWVVEKASDGIGGGMNMIGVTKQLESELKDGE